MRTLFTALALLISVASAVAEVRIVALGASNTYGQGRGRTAGGVAQSEAYPAQLEAMLRARGIDARVVNEGRAGDTTTGMLARLSSAVPNGTALVILQPGGNDARRGDPGAPAGNIAEIRRQLAARGIPVIVMSSLGSIAPATTRDPDGQHFNAQGHRAFAAWLLPRVTAATGRKR